MACFGIYFFSARGSQLIDGTLSTHLVLCNIQIEDTRENTTSKITKYLCRKDWHEPYDSMDVVNPNSAAQVYKDCRTEQNYMLDLTAIIKENDTFGKSSKFVTYFI